jgi:hypothetical protein
VRRGCVAEQFAARSRCHGGVTEWLMVADCKSAGLTPYVGSNPTPTMNAGQMGRWAAGQCGAVIEAWDLIGKHDGADRPRGPADLCPADNAGVAQLVEHQPSKLRVAGSSPVARSFRGRADALTHY